MNSEWLQSFSVFAEKCNFTKAAQVLHISQPALHVQIKKLSEEVGVTLYRRQGRALQLTAEGKRLAAYGRRVRAQETELLAQLRGESLSGPVLLAAGPGAFMYLLGPALRQFPKSKWRLQLQSRNALDSVTALRNAEANLAVTVLDRPLGDLACTALRSVGQMLVVRNEHPLAKRHWLRPRDLRGQELVVAPAGRPHRQMLAQAMRTAEAPWQVAVEASGWELMLDFVGKGMGAAVVNDFCKVPRGCKGVPLRGLPKVTYYLVERESASEGVRRMRELILSTASSAG